MITERLYYTDSYSTAFEANVISTTIVNEAPAAILDRTCFYPTSGGQPHDTGTLNGAAVLEVIVRESAGAVLHILDRALSVGRVSGQVDWARRFDHMQHHTGQHILSQAFERLARAETVGFHMSADSITIDLDQPDLAPATVDAAEDLANQIVTEDRPVRAWFPTDDEVAALALRKVPDVEGRFRVVAVEGFDVTACGGTHVAHTGEIGLIKVLRT
ncbi:MAG: alanyl-tRNA editing protein, partial [Chloroflexota bacterium]